MSVYRFAEPQHDGECYIPLSGEAAQERRAHNLRLLRDAMTRVEEPMSNDKVDATFHPERKVKVTLSVDTSQFASALRKARWRTIRTALWSVRGGLAATAILASAVGYALGVITTLG